MGRLAGKRGYLRHFEQLSTSIGDVFWACSADMQKVLYVSPGAEAIWGRSTDAMGATPLDQLRWVHPDDRSIFVEDFLAQVNGAVSEDYVAREFRIVRPDGGERWVWARSMPIRDEDGEVTMMAGVSVDVTRRRNAEVELERARDELERRVAQRTRALSRLNDELRKEIAERTRVEAELRESESRYRMIAEHTSELHAELDSDLRYIDASQSHVDIMGLPPGHLLGRSVLEVVHPDEVEFVERTLREVLHTGESARAIVRTRERNGHCRFLDAAVVPRVGKDGRWTILACSRDITEQRMADQRFRALVESAPDPLVMIDDEGRIVLFNGRAEETFGHARESVIGQPIEMLIPGRLRARHVERRNSAFDRWADRSIGVDRVLYGLKKSGEEFPVEIRLSHISTEEGRLFVASVRDVGERLRREEERRLLEAQVQQRQRLEGLGLLAGGIAHDFNNLLGAVMNYANLALIRLEPESPAGGAVQEIKAVARQMADLSSQMLASSGRGRAEKGPLDLSAQIREMKGLLQAAVKKAKVEYRLADALPTIDADAAQVRQLILNLIINASESLSEKAGRIEVETGLMTLAPEMLASSYQEHSLDAGEYVFVRVSDTGCGMDAETRARLFDPFFTTKGVGRGLGLASALGIVKAHGGMIHVESEPGAGTSFRVFFPPALSLSLTLERAPADPAEEAPGPAVILLVDDERGMREPAAALLRSSGFQVVTAEDGIEAVEILEARPDRIDLAIVDLTMPQLGGVETLRALRQVREDLPVLLSSGYPVDELSDLHAQEERVGFIRKPYELASLLAKIAEQLGGTAASPTASASPGARPGSPPRA